MLLEQQNVCVQGVYDRENKREEIHFHQAKQLSQA